MALTPALKAGSSGDTIYKIVEIVATRKLGAFTAITNSCSLNEDDKDTAVLS